MIGSKGTERFNRAFDARVEGGGVSVILGSAQ
jgi:hypothetical protein